MPVEYRNPRTCVAQAGPNDLDWTEPLAGPLVVTQAFEPADATLAASQFVLWLDPTPGAVVLNVKFKDSAGTVVKKSIVLS